MIPSLITVSISETEAQRTNLGSIEKNSESGVEPDPDRKGRNRLDDFSIASQLSFFLWNSAPDSTRSSAAARTCG